MKAILERFTSILYHTHYFIGKEVEDSIKATRLMKFTNDIEQRSAAGRWIA